VTEDRLSENPHKSSHAYEYNSQMLPRDLSSLSTFLLVAEERSFTRAAKRQGVSPSAVSHSMRALEEEVGVRLLARTTRSVALTEAGEQLLSRLRPALADVGETLEEISGGRDKAAGRIRLLLPRLAVSSVLSPKLGKLSREYPDLILDVTTDDSRRDIVAEGFDAGIHFGEYIQKDMIAVRVSPDLRPAIVGSPEYLESHPRPKLPRDLLLHRCINFRHGSAGLYRWEFEKGKKSLSVAVSGSLIVDDLELVIRGAVEGVGLAYVTEQDVAKYLADGTLVPVLQDWCQPYPGFFIYYPSRRQKTAALSALVSTLRC
jgi:DNA-binding transcriptional LysR family regulator